MLEVQLLGPRPSGAEILARAVWTGAGHMGAPGSLEHIRELAEELVERVVGQERP